MPLCPRYITLCHPNSGVDNSAPPLQTRARVCVLPVRRNQAGAVAHRVPREKEPNRRSGTVGLPKASISQTHLNQAGLWHCWSGVLFPTKRAKVALLVRASVMLRFTELPSDQSGTLALLVRDFFSCPFPNQAGRSGAVGRVFCVL